MKKKIYIGEQDGERALRQAWLDCFQKSIEEDVLINFLSKPKGTMMLVREADDDYTDTVYWIAVGNSKAICKEAWADFWPLLDDSILNWEIIDIGDEV